MPRREKAVVAVKLFSATLGQMALLLLLIALGYLLGKLRYLPDSAAKVLSRLENAVFIPALVLDTFISQCTPEKIASSWKLLLGSLAVEAAVIPVSLLLARACSRDGYLRRIYAYGLSFSNFAFMGNAVVSALFPDIFLDYLIFTLPLWTLIYAWGVPALLMPKESGRRSFAAALRPLANPMFAAMLAGLCIGLSAVPLPAFLSSAISVCGGCMSPVAMLLTGITVSRLDLAAVLKEKSIYLVSLFRLLLFPALFALPLKLLGASGPFYACLVCSLAMPLGLNTIVIPSAYGLDTSAASGMALVSHLFSIVTIPVVFRLMLGAG